MRVILWNLKRFAQNRTLFFALTIVCVLTSSWLMLFGYGMYQNYRLEKEYITEEALQFSIKGAHVEPPEKTEENKHYIHISYKPFTKGGLDECIAKIPNDILNNIALWRARLGTPENPLDGPYCCFYYQDGQCYASTWMWDQRYDHNVWPTPSGRFFSETEMAETAKVAISSSEKLKLGEYIVFLGKAYKIIGIGCGVDQILYEAAPDDTSMCFITLTLKRPLTAKQYEEFSAAFIPFGSTNWVQTPIYFSGATASRGNIIGYEYVTSYLCGTTVQKYGNETLAQSGVVLESVCSISVGDKIYTDFVHCSNYNDLGDSGGPIGVEVYQSGYKLDLIGITSCKDNSDSSTYACKITNICSGLGVVPCT